MLVTSHSSRRKLTRSMSPEQYVTDNSPVVKLSSSFMCYNG